jgi:molybdopterin biosynthesis enzyme
VLALQGAKDPRPRFAAGVLGRRLRRNAHRDELVRARTRLQEGDEPALVLEPLDGQESHMIARAAAADALVFVPRGDGELREGAAVRFLRLGS